MDQIGPSSFISCDWGTSRLRLRYVEVPSMMVRGEAISSLGISKTFELWQEQGSRNGRIDFFTGFLREELAHIKNLSLTESSGLPLICSGMASSSLGIEEVPYATLPFALDGTGATISKVFSKALPNPLMLIGGIQSQDDLMRGEETELLGIASLFKNMPDNYLAIFPGTHSKHIHVENRKITEFHTFMTGELFRLLQDHGTLKHSLQGHAEPNWESFRKGVLLSEDRPLLNSLFRVRVHELLGMLTKEQNYDFLSGLLIGAELYPLKLHEATEIFLMGSTVHMNYYKSALGHLGMNDRLRCIEGDLSNRAAIHGQWLIYQQQMRSL